MRSGSCFSAFLFCLQMKAGTSRRKVLQSPNRTMLQARAGILSFQNLNIPESQPISNRNQFSMQAKHHIIFSSLQRQHLSIIA